MDGIKEIIIAFASGGILVAIIDGIHLRWQTKIQIMNESITKERKEYREFMRDASVKFVTSENESSMEKVKNEIILRLNPYDPRDQLLVELMNLIIDSKTDRTESQVLKEKFIYSMQCLLKFDWERSKSETKISEDDLTKFLNKDVLIKYAKDNKIEAEDYNTIYLKIKELSFIEEKHKFPPTEKPDWFTRTSENKNPAETTSSEK